MTDLNEQIDAAVSEWARTLPKDPPEGPGVPDSREALRERVDGLREQMNESSVQDPAREAAFGAVFDSIAALPPRAADEYGQAFENGRVWRGVYAALDAFELAQREHVVPKVLYDNLKQLRDEARAEVQVLQERIRKALECLGELDDLGRVTATESPNYPSVASVSSATLRAILSGSDTATNTEDGS